MNIDKSFQSAVRYYKTGKLREAEHLCRQIIKKRPKHVDALNLLGLVCYYLADYDSAIKYIKKALELDESNAEAYTNLGNAYKNNRQLDKAIGSYEKAIKIKPHLAMAHNNLGSVLQEKGRLEEAAACYREAFKIDPNFAEAYNNMASLFLKRKEFEKAVTYFHRAIKLNPDFAEAYFNLGSVFQAQGLLDDAIDYFQKAINFNPKLVQAYNSLGVTLREEGRLEEAIACYQKALELNPAFADAYNGLGNALQAKWQLDDAVECYERVLEINPNSAGAYYNLGNTLQKQGRQDEAEAAFDKALSLKPDFMKARWARCISRLLIIYPDHHSILVSRRSYREELMKLRDTILHEFLRDADISTGAVGSMQPFYLAYQGLNDRELQQIYGETVCQIMASKYPEFSDRPAMPPLSSGEPLRVGVVSGYFHLHSNWKIPIRGWVQNLDRHRFSLYGYYTGRKKDKETEVARQSFSRFVGDIYRFEDLCSSIRADNLHVLIYPEIGMDPVTAKLAAVRLAPVQCCSWGHPDTSGFPTIDYFLSSDLMEPPEADDHYTERLIRLPNLSVYYTPPDVPSVAVDRDSFGLRPKSILYLCCQSLFKYLPQYDEVYPRIAQRVGDCQFLFISFFESSRVTEQLLSRLKQAFDRFNLNSDEYVVFLPYLDPDKYNALNGLADIYLDSIGWSGCNSTFEALARNLPVVTLPGELMRGRHSSAILAMMRVTETIASTLDEYVELAVRLALDPDWREQLSEQIAVNKHLIYHDRTCIDALEIFLENAVRSK